MCVRRYPVEKRVDNGANNVQGYRLGYPISGGLANVQYCVLVGPRTALKNLPMIYLRPSQPVGRPVVVVVVVVLLLPLLLMIERAKTHR